MGGSRFVLFLVIAAMGGFAYLIIQWTNNEITSLRAGAASTSSIEVESGTLSGNVTKATDADTSYILFQTNDSVSKRTLYVSPSGSDTNSGTEIQPLKTFFKASQIAIAGDLILFEDGTYDETQTTIVGNGGTLQDPIVFRARNKHKAVIFYRGMSDKWKMDITGKPHIQIRDFEITQDAKGGTGSDKFINFFESADFGVVSGNKIHNAFEDLIKIGQTNNILVEDNILYDVTREAFDQVAGAGTVIKNNRISDFHREGVMVKGGARNIEIVNNSILRSGNTTYVVGMTLGGSSDAEFAYNSSGYEGYNIAAYNNIIVAETPGAIAEGLGITGCDNCSATNNIVLGADIAITIADGPGKSKGWTVDVHTRNPMMYNNILMDCSKNAYWQYDTPVGTRLFDNNLIFNCPRSSAPQQIYGVYSDPLFVNKKSDWHLLSNSPAIGKGRVIPPLPVYSGNATPQASPIITDTTRDGAQRNIPWNMGVY